MVVLFIHVDDSMITGSSLALNRMFIKQITEHFEITDLGPISWLLCLAVVRNRNKRTLSLSQSFYIESLLCHFKMEDTKIVNVPINSDMRLTTEDCPVSAKGKLDMNIRKKSNLL